MIIIYSYELFVSNVDEISLIIVIVMYCVMLIDMIDCLVIRLFSEWIGIRHVALFGVNVLVR